MLYEHPYSDPSVFIDRFIGRKWAFKILIGPVKLNFRGL